MIAEDNEFAFAIREWRKMVMAPRSTRRPEVTPRLASFAEYFAEAQVGLGDEPVEWVYDEANSLNYDHSGALAVESADMEGTVTVTKVSREASDSDLDSCAALMGEL